jgi:hypothetical protein
MNEATGPGDWIHSTEAAFMEGGQEPLVEWLKYNAERLRAASDKLDDPIPPDIAFRLGAMMAGRALQAQAEKPAS